MTIMSAAGERCHSAAIWLSRKGPYVDGSVLARVLLVIRVGRCSHMSGLLMRHIKRPLAIMLSAEIRSLSTTRVHVDALALMGCPDLRIDRLSHYMQMPFPNFLTPTGAT